MNSRANLIRRLAGDFVQRMRIALATTEDAAPIVDQLDRNLAEAIAGDVCATIGVDYEGPPEQATSKGDGKPGAKARAASPWQKNRGIRYGKRG